MSSSLTIGVCFLDSSVALTSSIFAWYTDSGAGLRHHSGFASRKPPPRSLYSLPSSGSTTNSHSSFDVTSSIPLDVVNGMSLSSLPQCSASIALSSEASIIVGVPTSASSPPKKVSSEPKPISNEASLSWANLALSAAPVAALRSRSSSTALQTVAVMPASSADLSCDASCSRVSDSRKYSKASTPAGGAIAASTGPCSESEAIHPAALHESERSSLGSVLVSAAAGRLTLSGRSR